MKATRWYSVKKHKITNRSGIRQNRNCQNCKLSLLIAVAKYSNDRAQQGRTESRQRRQMESAACRFLLREENWITRRKTLEAEKRTNTNSTHLWHRVRESNLGHIGERRVRSPQRHPCFLLNIKERFCFQSREYEIREQIPEPYDHYLLRIFPRVEIIFNIGPMATQWPKAPCVICSVDVIIFG